MWKLLNIEGLVYLEDGSLLVKDNDRLGEGVTEEDCNGVKSGATDLTPQDSGYQENGLTTVGLQVQATARKHCSVKEISIRFGSNHKTHIKSSMILYSKAAST